ncbi:MAG: DegV family protein [Lachnospiraceae bacterium]|nr:DegV family protein [Lachnospiraceae bacterium]
MKKIAMVTDTNSGITPAEAQRLGIYVIPMPVLIDGETYYEGINLTHEEFYEKLAADASVSTSQPSPGAVMDMWDEVLKEHEELLYFPMSSGLSSSCETAMMLAEDYDGRVHVVDNQRISVTLARSILDAMELRDRGYSAGEIKAKLEEVKLDASIYIMVDTLKYLKKGGRLTPAVAALGTLLRIKPVLQIQGEKLDNYAKARTVAQAKSTMIAALKNDIETRFGGVENQKVWLGVAYTDDLKAAEVLKEELLAAMPGYTEVMLAPLSLSVSCHIGPGAIGVGCMKKLD